MMGRRLLLLVPVLLVGTVLLRPAQGAKLTKDVRETTNAAAVRPKIQELVTAEVAKLSSDNPTAQHDGREALVAEVQAAGANPATPSVAFLDAYADVLNTALLPLAKNPSPRVRLNAGIVAERVAEKANNGRLIPVVVELLNDQQSPIVLWGIKATKFLIVPALSGPGAKTNPLAPAFVAAVKKNVATGPMVAAAYDVFKTVPSGTTAPAVAAMVQTLHQVMEARRDQFMRGVPEMPSSETFAMTFLSDDKVWKTLDPKLQLQTIQLISDIIALAGKHVRTAQGTDRNDLAYLLNKAGSALRVIAIQQPKIEPAARALNGVSSTTAVEKIEEVTNAMYPALKEAWKDLKPPPQLQTVQ